MGLNLTVVRPLGSPYSPRLTSTAHDSAAASAPVASAVAASAVAASAGLASAERMRVARRANEAALQLVHRLATNPPPCTCTPLTSGSAKRRLGRSFGIEVSAVSR